MPITPDRSSSLESSKEPGTRRKELISKQSVVGRSHGSPNYGLQTLTLRVYVNEEFSLHFAIHRELDNIIAQPFQSRQDLRLISNQQDVHPVRMDPFCREPVELIL